MTALDSLPVQTAAVLFAVAAERERQNKQWRRTPGVWDEPDGIKLAVLVEEVGEVASEIQPGGSTDKLRAEPIQVAAVAVAWAETLP